MCLPSFSCLLLSFQIPKLNSKLLDSKLKHACLWPFLTDSPSSWRQRVDSLSFCQQKVEVVDSLSLCRQRVEAVDSLRFWRQRVDVVYRMALSFFLPLPLSLSLSLIFWIERIGKTTSGVPGSGRHGRTLSGEAGRWSPMRRCRSGVPGSGQGGRTLSEKSGRRPPAKKQIGFG